MISVIICTHNPRRDYLERTIAGLRAQSLDVSQWELLVVDNNSDEAIRPEGLVDWHPRGRVVREEEAGITAARMRGAAESQGALLVFVDDDTVLDAGYLEETGRIAEEFPFLGSWGPGRIEPEYEVPPPDHVHAFTHLLAIRNARQAQWGNGKVLGNTPVGAGMVVRRAVADSYREAIAQSPIRRFLSRAGSSPLTGGNDLDLAYQATALGMGMGVFPSLRLVHLIPARRLELDYLLRLARACATGHHLMRYIHHGEWPPFERMPRLDALRGAVARFRGRGLRHLIQKARIEGSVAAFRMLREMRGESKGTVGSNP